MSIQSTVQSRLDRYSPSMRRVAEKIVSRPEVVMELTISQLARQCDTSETTIIRFCRSIDLTGYVQLRLAMAAEIGSERAQLGAAVDHGSDVSGNDSLAASVARIAFSERIGLEETMANLDLSTLEQVIAAIARPGRTLTYGIGASWMSAVDLQRKLLRIDHDAATFADAHEALAVAGLLGPADVAIAFSHTGETTESIELLRVARSHGATTVGVTNDPGSTLAAHADLGLFTTVRETVYRSGAMSSRIAQLMLVDCIFVGVAQRNPAATKEALQRTSHAVAGLRRVKQKAPDQ